MSFFNKTVEKPSSNH